MRRRSRSASPKKETRIRKGETLEETYQNVLNLREEYAGKVDSLLNEATGKRAESEVFEETGLTKIVHEDSEVMVLHLKQDRDGPVSKQTQWLSRRRFSKRRSKAGRPTGGGRWGYQAGRKEHFPGRLGL